MAWQLELLTLRRLARCLVAVSLLAVAGAPRAAAEARPASTQAIVQFDAGVTPAEQRAAVKAAGGVVIRDLHVIRGLGVVLSTARAARLARATGVRAVTPNARMRPSAVAGRWATWNPDMLATAFVQSTRADKAWTDKRWHATGAHVAVAVLDTGVAGDVQDFVSSQSGGSRVIASVVTNPDATTAADRYGHGTHVAGLIAGNGRALAASDPLFNRYIGTAPDADLVSIKVSDDHGNASLIDVIEGLQFVVDHGADYGVRVVNLSLSSSLALPYRLDPLDAAVEAAWLHGIVVVAAAGNQGTDADAVSYAPANDPYAITVGAVDDHGTKATDDDSLAPWSSRGVTQDGFAKPELVAPGSHIVGPLAPGSDYASLCGACVVEGRYFRVGGTSMAAPIVAGIAADIIAAHPTWTPDQVKGALTYNSGTVDANGEPIANLRATSDGSWEVAADAALNAGRDELVSNVGLVPSWFIDPATGSIDETRASWGRASWKDAVDQLRASWGAASWAAVQPLAADETVDASLGRASWGRASWKSFFGDDPHDYGELQGGSSGIVPRGGAGQPASRSR
jgi:serine protease AprX